MSSALKLLTDDVLSTLSTLPELERVEENERMQLLNALDQLRVAIEPPTISIQNLCFGAHGIAAVRVAQGMGIFDAFVAAQGMEMTLAQLHKKTKGDQEFLVRVLRLLCCANVVKQAGDNSFKPSSLAMVFANGLPPGDAIKHFYSQMPISANLFKYCDKNGYKNPGDAYDGPFQFAFGTKDHYFDWLSKNPEDQQAFNSVMAMGRAYRAEDWFEFYPVEERLQTTSDSALFVDIAGGVGHDIREFRARFPDLAGKIILQDLPQVIDEISDPLPKGIDAMKYDMFTEQPIKGAKAYYMRTVLHDWPDKQALAALARIFEAMSPESILLLNENTLPSTDVPPYSAHLDFTMMEVFSSLERTEQQWIDLVTEAGFKFVKVWKPKALSLGSNILIEATLD